MKKLCGLLLVVFSLLFTHALSEQTYVRTEDFVPPVIDESVLQTEPWLLVLKTAQEEIGYKEGPKSNQTKYGEWFCGRRVAWCAEFLTWCVDQTDQLYGTNLMHNVYPFYGGSDDGAPWFKKKGRFVSDNGIMPQTNEKQWLVGANRYMKEHEYIPQAGDYMWLFYYSRKRGTDHVALVEGVSQDEKGNLFVHVIEGNNPDKVQRNVYEHDYKLIYGYGTPQKRAHTNLRLYYESEEVTLLAKQLEALGFYDKNGEDYPLKADKNLTGAIYRFKSKYKLSGGRIMDLKMYNKLNEVLEEKGIQLEETKE